ncbi:MAG: hypothetical protein ACE5JJ_02510 [Nitrospinota bacterium]
MKKSRRDLAPSLAGCAVAVLAVLLGVSTAWAYGYGAAEDPVLTAAKSIRAELGKGDPEWGAIRKAFGPARSVLAKMDKDYQQRIVPSAEKAFATKNKKELRGALDKGFYFLIRHKLENVPPNLKDFPKAKAILSSAKFYYEAIEVKVKARDLGLHRRIEAAFERAFEALGKPGMFGFGSQPADLKKFKAQEKAILDALAKAF